MGRDSPARPTAAENPLGAWYVTASIKGAPDGPLAGKKIAVKDNVCVAGLPMMNGSKVLEGFVPDTDATVVSRLLDAGAEITGKSVCESFCMSFGSHTADTGFVLNPHDHTRTTGGSSSGSAALVASNVVDMAIGCDEGGSIRVPSAFCGIVGLKPSWGLVPFTGIFRLEMTIDHVGPDGTHRARLRTDARNAGRPGRPGSHGNMRRCKSQPYTTLMKAGGKGLRIGILKEGFGLPDGEKDVDALVMDAAHRFEHAGANGKHGIRERAHHAGDGLSEPGVGSHVADGARLHGLGLEGPASDGSGRVLREASAGTRRFVSARSEVVAGDGADAGSRQRRPVLRARSERSARRCARLTIMRSSKWTCWLCRPWRRVLPSCHRRT